MAGGDVPRAFFSYVRQVDDHDGGRLSRLRNRLQGEIRVQTGLKVDIFQDIQELKWGDRWDQRLLEAAAGSLFLIPIVTPGYFLSDPCRQEYEAFRTLEARRGIRGVIMPIYYVETDELSDPAWQEGNAWIQEVAAMQWADWRTLRLEPWESPEPHRRVEQMAKAFKAKLKELGILRPRLADGVPAASRSTVVASAASATTTEKSATNAETPKVESASGPAPLPKRREIVVDASGAGQFRTISDAVKAAAADDILLVRPGAYKESISIEKSLTIIGDGRREEIVVETESGNVFRLKAPFGRLVNLTIRRLKGPGQNPAVWIQGGRFELEGCDITSAVLPGVTISGDADPTIRRNTVHDCDQAGIHIYDRARATVEDNELFGNRLAAIEVKDSAAPTIRRNRIHDGRACGILVNKKSTALIEDNEIFGNEMSGIEIKYEAEPTVRRNGIHDQRQNGLLIVEAGKGTIEDNTISANTFAGVEVRTGGNPTVRSNRITDNKYEGIWVHKGGRGTFEDNDLRQNARGPWDIEPDCVANVKQSGNIEK